MKLSPQEKAAHRAAFQAMSPGKKLEHILTYYKAPILLALLLLFILGSVVHRQLTQKEELLYLGLLNVSIGEDLEEGLNAGYLRSAGLDETRQEVYLYRDLYLSDNADVVNHEYAYASRMKVMGAIQAKKLDLVLMNREAYDLCSRNGYLMALDTWLPGIDAAEALDPDAVPLTGAIVERPFLPVYMEQLAARIRRGLETDAEKPLQGLHVVVDAGNGAGGFYAALMESLGARTEGSQFLEPDGMFPNHRPNPEDPVAMDSISAAVKKAGADLGVIFDADCDRAAVVDADGREINRNRLIALMSAILLEDRPGQTIVTDSVTSSGLKKFITAWGGEHYRFKRGYRNVIDEAIRLNKEGTPCPLAIETSGHAALQENHFLDDGMYLVTVLIVKAMKLKQEGKSLGSLIADLQEPVESTEIRLSITAEDFRAAGEKAIDRVLAYAEAAADWHIAPDNREGVRISFDLDGGQDNGWFLLRLSVHDPVLPLNCESDVPGGVKQMLKALLNVLDGTEGIDLSALRAAVEQG